jgi:hypothetical protein
VSILSKPGGVRRRFQSRFRQTGVAGAGDRVRWTFVFEMYRRHMKTIGYLGQIDKRYGVP